MAPRCSQDGAKIPLSGPNWAQQAFKKRPGAPKMWPRRLQDGSGTPKPSPKAPQDPPETPQDSPKALKNCGFWDPNVFQASLLASSIQWASAGCAKRKQYGGTLRPKDVLNQPFFLPSRPRATS